MGSARLDDKLQLMKYPLARGGKSLVWPWRREIKLVVRGKEEAEQSCEYREVWVQEVFADGFKHGNNICFCGMCWELESLVLEVILDTEFKIKKT